jgi:SAM-dependent methyltransferase
MNYDDTIKFWDGIFSKGEKQKLDKPLPYPELEKTLNWLAKDSDSVLDYGCGDGVLLVRCYYLGIESGLGIDISQEAVQKGMDNLEENNIDSYIIEKGNHLKLKEIKDDFFDSAILSNIIDNVLPEDGEFILEEIHRIVKPNGKILIKLNDYIDDKEVLNNKEIFKEELQKNFYLETSGLYLHNLSDANFEEIISPYFGIEDKFFINFKKFNQKNRIWLLRNK